MDKIYGASIRQDGLQKVGRNRWDLFYGFGKDDLRVGDKVARGQLHTLKIIAHRDYILQDANVNLPIPKRTDSQTMAENLASCISAVQASHANASKYQQYYYPAASYCHAYVPETDKPDEVVAEKFGEGRWSLASIGELSRCTWYHLKGYVVGANHNIFAKGVMYALECFNVTAAHKKAVSELTTIEEVEKYDITAGYPAQLRMEV